MKKKTIFLLVMFAFFATSCAKKDESLVTEEISSIEFEYAEESQDFKNENIKEDNESEGEQKLNVIAWTSETVNFRSGPSISAEAIGKVPRYSEILILKDLGDWNEICFEERTGYIAAEYVTYEEPKGNGIIVCIDPGHQRKGDSKQEPNGPGSGVTKARVTGGTTGRTTGVAEYQLNLDISLMLRDELEARGYTVVMTRESHDVNISNMERAQIATNAGADITVRIHANGSDNTGISGALTMAPSSTNPYVSSIADASYRLSKSVIDSYCLSTGLNNQGVIITDTMTGINWCTMPVTIVEMGYMTNPSDDINMQDSTFQSKMVAGIADGIDNYFR